MPWKPSQPATTAHSSVCRSPACVKAMLGASEVRPSSSTSETSKQDLGVVAQARGDEVLDDLLLAVDRDRPAVGEPAEVDAVALAVEAQLEAAVDERLAVQTVAEAGVGEQLDRALLQDARADPVLDVLAAAVLEHDRRDPLEVEEVREQQAGRPGPHDSDLCPHLSGVLSYPGGGRSIANRPAVLRDGYPRGRPEATRAAAGGGVWCAGGVGGGWRAWGPGACGAMREVFAVSGRFAYGRGEGAVGGRRGGAVAWRRPRDEKSPMGGENSSCGRLGRALRRRFAPPALGPPPPRRAVRRRAIPRRAPERNAARARPKRWRHARRARGERALGVQTRRGGRWSGVVARLGGVPRRPLRPRRRSAGVAPSTRREIPDGRGELVVRSAWPAPGRVGASRHRRSARLPSPRRPPARHPATRA